MTHVFRKCRNFFYSEKGAGTLLIVVTLFSILLTNSPVGATYLALWHTKIGADVGGLYLKHSLGHWINDGLMAVFFLMVGLEIKRELVVGSLAKAKNAVLPILAAVGGMLVPAGLYLLLNAGTPTQSGFGIPMATDIAFSLGVLALLGSRVPVSLKVFLAALAIVDDLGAILVIAIFYVTDFSGLYLALALAVFAGLLLLNKWGVKALPAYLFPGLVMWYLMLQSGIHATLAGVLLAMAIPFVAGEHSPLDRLVHVLHRPVAYLIMPVFALANTCILLTGPWFSGLPSSSSLGIFLGLFLGKPLGIFFFSALAIKLGLATMPKGASWQQLFGIGCVAGIGFTMSIFITLLAFDDAGVVRASIMSILFASVLSGLVGFCLLKRMSWRSLEQEVG